MKRHRKAFGLSQRDIGELTGLGETYIGLLEHGSVSVGLDNIVKVADLFGVAFYDFLNPDATLPEQTLLHPDAQRHLSEKQSAQEKRVKAQEKRKDAGEKIYTTGTAKRLHALIEAGFFNKPRMAKDAYRQIHDLTGTETLTSTQQREISRITATLSQGKFLNTLDKLEPEPGSTAVRFIAKATNSIPYPDTPGHTDMAADK